MSSLLDMFNGKAESPKTVSLTVKSETSGIPPLERTHDEKYSPEIENIEAGIKDLMADLNKVALNNAGRSQSKPIYRQKNLKSSEVVKSFTARSNNKKEKDEFTDWIGKLFKNDEDLRAKFLAATEKYAKVTNLQFSQNKKILANAIEKSKEGGYEPSFFAQKMKEFVDDFKNLILPVMKKAHAAGINLKFFSWGAIQESFKDDFRTSFSNALKLEGSLKFLYSKVAAYGVTVPEAAFASERIIACTCYMAIFAVEAGYLSKELLADPKIDNQKVIDAIRAAGIKDKLKAEKTPEENKKLILNVKEGITFEAAALMAAGIAPNMAMQSYQYKMATTTINREVIDQTFKSVAKNFNIIRNAHIRITGVRVVYASTMFKACLTECYKMWRPIFVVARVLRSFVYPQPNYAVNANIDLAEFNVVDDMNEDIDLTAYFKGG